VNSQDKEYVPHDFFHYIAVTMPSKAVIKSEEILEAVFARIMNELYQSDGGIQNSRPVRVFRECDSDRSGRMESLRKVR
jgi:hypothetical protein